MKLRFGVLALVASVALPILPAFAKIAPIKPVPPVEVKGVRYSGEGDGRDQYVKAVEIATGKQLWRMKVCHTRIKFWMEEDVQWTFITNLVLVNDLLLVRDSKSRCYTIGIADHRVRKSICSVAFPTR